MQPKSERRAEVQTESQNEARLEHPETAVYPRGALYMPSQSTTNEAYHTLDIVGTSSHADQESISDDDEEDHYDKPSDPYEGLDTSDVVPPTPSVYDHITH